MQTQPPKIEPTTELHAGYSSPDATPTSWDEARQQLAAAEIFWLTTVRPDSRPHVTPLLAVWREGSAYFCTGADERKAKNLDQNPHCVLTTGCNALDQGLDLVIEGDAERETDDTQLRAIAGDYATKYGSDWRYDVRDGAFVGPHGNEALVYRVTPSTAFGFGKGAFSQTRWRFPPA